MMRPTTTAVIIPFPRRAGQAAPLSGLVHDRVRGRTLLVTGVARGAAGEARR
ncbi:MAG: hypothetical protein N2688_00080 [Burkholderiaceae bacterium]|nr:hypothetical protein [Burkholderiaceae bacterium]